MAENINPNDTLIVEIEKEFFYNLALETGLTQDQLWTLLKKTAYMTVSKDSITDYDMKDIGLPVGTEISEDEINLLCRGVKELLFFLLPNKDDPLDLEYPEGYHHWAYIRFEELDLTIDHNVPVWLACWVIHPYLDTRFIYIYGSFHHVMCCSEIHTHSDDGLEHDVDVMNLDDDYAATYLLCSYFANRDI